MNARRAALVTAAALLGAPAGARADLPTVPGGVQPGPAALHLPPPDAPQLQNIAPWTAAPLLVSGGEAYSGGEWLAQDFLNDDHGALGVKDPGDPHDVGSYLFAPKTGSLTYPSDPVFADNAADLVELRVKPVAGATAFRITLNTLKDAARTGVTLALGSSDAPRAWPDGAGVRSPAARFVTVHGSTATARDAAGGAVLPGATVSVDLTRRQLDVRVPTSVWDPGSGVQRITAGAGLWDPAGGQYLAAGAARTATAPGGAGTSRLFNVMPRPDEPNPDITQGGAGITIADAAAGAIVDGAWWREKQQATQLALGDVTPFAGLVDFGKLARGVDDTSRVPKTGPLNRILASRHAAGQGIEPSRVCFDLPTMFAAGARCVGRFVGQLQSYALYVPRKAAPKDGYGMTLLLHSLSANQNQYSASNNQSQLGERGTGSLVATPAGRGPDGFYAGVPEDDAFEVWADVARHYPVDGDRAVVTGYSMGGFGTYRLLARWPDLFARGASVVGIPGTVEDQLASLRNTPLLSWNSGADELVRIDESEAAVAANTAAGIRFRHDLFPAADHLTLATNDEYGPLAAFLEADRVDRDPPHVTYVVDAKEDSAEAVADHAYWVSGVAARDAGKAGTIDVRSEGFGVGDAPVLPVAQSAGTLDGGARGPAPFTQRERAWGSAPAAPKADRLVVRGANVRAATIDTARARVSCAPQLDVQGGVELALTCPTLRSCAKTVRLVLPRVKGRRIVRAAVTRRKAKTKTVRGKDLRVVRVTRPGERAFSVKLYLRTGGTPARRIVVTRRVGACG